MDAALALSHGLTRWHAASASAFLEANAGLQYVFGDVSGSLRTRLGYTQRQIDGLGTAKDCGTAVVDVMAGFMFDGLGAPTTLIFIAVLNAAGFLGMLSAYTGVVQTSYSGMVLFTAVGFGGNGAMLLPGLVTSLGNFPEVRGMVTGLLKSVFFLCASIYTEWDLLLHQRTDAFLLLLAFLPACAALACIPLLKHLPKQRRSGGSAAAVGAEGLATRRTFFAASGLTFGIALYMAVTVLLQSEKPATFLPLVPLAFTAMLLLLSLYASLPIVNRSLEESALAASSTAMQAPLLGEGRGPSAYGSISSLADASPASPPKGDESHYVGEAANGTLLQTLGRTDYWCIYTLYVINLAVGLTLSNNLESIAVAKGATTVAGYVALSSVATCMGTLLGAHVSEAALDAHIALARPWCCSPAYGLITLGSIAVASGGRGVLYAAVFATMFGYGANLSILPAALHERYGQRHFGSIWAFSQTAMVVASSVFATGLAAHVYEKHASIGANGVQTCVGNECFRTTFLTLAALATGGAALAGVLATILADFYREVIAARSAAEPGGYFAALGLRADGAEGPGRHLL